MSNKLFEQYCFDQTTNDVYGYKFYEMQAKLLTPEEQAEAIIMEDGIILPSACISNEVNGCITPDELMPRYEEGAAPTVPNTSAFASSASARGGMRIDGLTVNNTDNNINVRANSENPNSAIIGQILRGEKYVHYYERHGSAHGVGIRTGSHGGPGQYRSVLRQGGIHTHQIGYPIAWTWGSYPNDRYWPNFHFRFARLENVLTTHITLPGNRTANRYCIFRVRRQAQILRPNGTNWGTAAANTEVACAMDTVGQNNPHFKQIDFVLRTDGRWIAVDNPGGILGGFIDIGFGHGATRTTATFHGTARSPY